MRTIVTRYRVEDSRGRVLTAEGWFSRETDDALRFWDEDAAHEAASEHPGATVESFQCLSEFPGFSAHREAVGEFLRRAG
jgi:hypothetical protein